MEHSKSEKKRRQKKRQRRVFLSKICVVCFICTLGWMMFTGFSRISESLNTKGLMQIFAKSSDSENAESGNSISEETTADGDSASAFEADGLTITTDYLPVNEYSRPGDALGEVKTIFVHYTANQNTSAKQNRDYFASLGDNHITSASAHFIVGCEGEIIQCIPLSEIGYAVVGRNMDSVSIECCYEDESGKFNEKTYASLIKLVAALMSKYNLTIDDVERHYDESGKLCPLYYVKNEEAWFQMKTDIDAESQAANQ